MNKLFFIAIDPALYNTGYTIVEKNNKEVKIVDYNIFKTKSCDLIQKKLYDFSNFFEEKLLDYNISKIFIETPFLGKNPQNFLKLGYLRGILYIIAYKNNIEIDELSPREIKMAITGYGDASKEQVLSFIVKLLPVLKNNKNLDISDSVAIAIAGLIKNKMY